MNHATYKPVPVIVAAAIAEQFSKDLVVILSYDRAANLVHTTTYGQTADDKLRAADLGEIVTAAAGCDLTQKRTYEDFRRDAARIKAENDRLRRRILELETELDAAK